MPVLNILLPSPRKEVHRHPKEQVRSEHVVPHQRVLPAAVLVDVRHRELRVYGGDSALGRITIPGHGVGTRGEVSVELGAGAYARRAVVVRAADAGGERRRDVHVFVGVDYFTLVIFVRGSFQVRPLVVDGAEDEDAVYHAGEEDLGEGHVELRHH